jgi:DNA-binding response OmpR family regulator
VSGAQALAELEANPARFGAPLTDVRLGQPDGWEVARWARELVPRMPVLYVTGDSAHEWHTQGVPNSLVVAKPFVAAQIVTALRALLIEADSR